MRHDLGVGRPSPRESASRRRSSSTSAPTARSAAPIAAMRSDSLTRSSAAPRTSLVPSAAAIATASSGSSSISGATRSRPSAIARSRRPPRTINVADRLAACASRGTVTRDLGAHLAQHLDQRGASRVQTHVARVAARHRDEWPRPRATPRPTRSRRAHVRSNERNAAGPDRVVEPSASVLPLNVGAQRGRASAPCDRAYGPAPSIVVVPSAARAAKRMAPSDLRAGHRQLVVAAPQRPARRGRSAARGRRSSRSRRPSRAAAGDPLHRPAGSASRRRSSGRRPVARRECAGSSASSSPSCRSRPLPGQAARLPSVPSPRTRASDLRPDGLRSGCRRPSADSAPTVDRTSAPGSRRRDLRLTVGQRREDQRAVGDRLVRRAGAASRAARCAASAAARRPRDGQCHARSTASRSRWAAAWRRCIWREARTTADRTICELVAVHRAAAASTVPRLEQLALALDVVAVAVRALRVLDRDRQLGSLLDQAAAAASSTSSIRPRMPLDARRHSAGAPCPPARRAQVLEPPQLVHQLAELGERQRLVAVGARVRRIGMDLDDQAVGADRRRRRAPSG